MNGAIDPMGPIQIQQLPNLQHMYPQQLQHHQQQQPQTLEDHRVQKQQFQGLSRVSPDVQFPQQYGVVSGPAGQIGAERTPLVHNRAYDQLIDSLKRATTVAQQKKILQTLRSNPSLMDVYLNKCKVSIRLLSLRKKLKDTSNKLWFLRLSSKTNSMVKELTHSIIISKISNNPCNLCSLNNSNTTNGSQEWE